MAIKLNFHTKATSKKPRPSSGNLHPNPPELPRSPSRGFSSREAGWKIVLHCALINRRRKIHPFDVSFLLKNVV